MSARMLGWTLAAGLLTSGCGAELSQQEASAAAVAFVQPPFWQRAPAGAADAWRDSVSAMTQPAGGLSPGAGWPADGISWTPETALCAWVAAEAGAVPVATNAAVIRAATVQRMPRRCVMPVSFGQVVVALQRTQRC